MELNDYVLDSNDLITNPNARVIICLVLDTSGSMKGTPISELNKGVQAFLNAIRNDEVAAMSAEVAIVTFGQKARVLLGFENIERQKVPVLKARGETIMGGAVTMALNLMESRKQEFRRAGVDYYQPWMVLMTDGRPGDNIESSVERTVDLVKRKKITVFPIAIGSKADVSTLDRFSPARKSLRLKGLNFKEFFEWLSASVSTTSRSSPGDKIELDLESINEWAEL